MKKIVIYAISFAFICLSFFVPSLAKEKVSFPHLKNDDVRNQVLEMINIEYKDFDYLVSEVINPVTNSFFKYILVFLPKELNGVLPVYDPGPQFAMTAKSPKPYYKITNEQITTTTVADVRSPVHSNVDITYVDYKTDEQYLVFQKAPVLTVKDIMEKAKVGAIKDMTQDLSKDFLTVSKIALIVLSGLLVMLLVARSLRLVIY